MQLPDQLSRKTANIKFDDGDNCRMDHAEEYTWCTIDLPKESGFYHIFFLEEFGDQVDDHCYYNHLQNKFYPHRIEHNPGTEYEFILVPCGYCLNDLVHPGSLLGWRKYDVKEYMGN